MGTLLAGNVARSLPILWIFGALAIFVLGGLTGVMVALAPFDFQAHDSFFVVAHFHYALIGGALFPVIAGVYYFYPMVTAKLLSERVGRIAFWIAFVGFNLTFMPMHLTGMRGMPRRVFTYPAGLGWDALNLVSSIGAVVLGIGVLLVFIDVLRPKHPPAPRNPWQAGTLEWAQEMPGKLWGIRSIPEIDGRYPLWQQPNILRDIDEGRFFLPDAEELRRETLITSVVDASAQQVQRLPSSSFLPLLAALTTGGFFILGTFHAWWPALGSLAAAVGVITYWLWTGTARPPEKERKDVGLGLQLPLYASGPSSIGYWGVCITMLADLAAFISLIFGYFYFWTIHEDFPPEQSAGPGLFWPLLAAALSLGAWASSLLARRFNRADRAAGFYLASLAAPGLALAAGAAVCMGPYATGLEPASHVYPAVVWLLAAWSALHLGVAALMSAYCIASRARGRTGPRHDIDIQNTALFWHFTLLTVGITVLVTAGFPLVS